MTDQPDQTDGTWIESLSLPRELATLTTREDFLKIPQSNLIYLHSSTGVTNLTPLIHGKVQENALLFRTLHTEIFTVLTQYTNTIGRAMNEHLAPLFNGISQALSSKPGEEQSPRDSVLWPELGARFLMEVRRVQVTEAQVLVDAVLLNERDTQENKVELEGLPGEDIKSHSIVLRIPLLRPEGIQLEMATDLAVNQVAKVSRVIREGSRLRTFTVSFSADVEPYSVNVGVNYPGGHLRIFAKKIERGESGRYLAHFEVGMDAARLGISIDRIFIDNIKAIPLDRALDVDSAATALAPPSLVITEWVLPDSIGMWGFRGREQVFEKKFSHADPVHLGLAGTQSKTFIINPFDHWIQFEVRQEQEIIGVELVWNVMQSIVDVTEVDKNRILTRTVDFGGHKRSYRVSYGGGTWNAGTTQREFLSFDPANFYINSRASRPGFKTVRALHQRPYTLGLRDLSGEGEAYMLPMVNPVGLKITTATGATYFHQFPASRSQEDIRAEIQKSCQDALTEKK